MGYKQSGVPSFCVESTAFKNKSWDWTSGYGQVRRPTNPLFKKGHIKLDTAEVDKLLVTGGWRGLLALSP